MHFRKIVLLLLSFVLLCSACHRADPPVAESTPTSTPTEPPHTTPKTTEPTTVPTDPEPEIPLWYIEDPQYLSYEEFFAADRTLRFTFFNTPWYTRQENTLLRAQLDPFRDDDLLVVSSGGTAYPIPGGKNFTAHSYLGVNGTYIYLSSDTEIYRLDMLSGEAETIFTCDRLLRIESYDSLVLLCLAENEGVWNIYRMYLPTLHVDIMYEGIPTDTPLQHFHFSGNYSTQGPVVWTMMNPEMAALLQKELTNPNSIYKSNSFSGREHDYSSAWGDPDLIAMKHVDLLECIMVDMQAHTDIPAWIMYSYDPADGHCTETYGIIDNCWIGSGYSHDHYDPHEYDMTPEWNVSDQVSISNISLPENPQKMYEEDVYADHEPNCIYIEGFICQGATRADEYDILFEIELTEVKFAPDYIYGITPDNTIVQASYDGTVRNTIYTADDALSDLEYGCGKLYFLEGNTIMEIDIPAKTYRSLLDISQYTYFTMYLDDANVLFFENARGLTVGMYIADFSKMTLKETHRL